MKAILPCDSSKNLSVASVLRESWGLIVRTLFVIYRSVSVFRCIHAVLGL